MMKRLMLFSVLVLTLALLMACSPNTPAETVILSPRLEEIKASGSIVIGTAITRPFEYRDPESNNLIGFDIDLMTAILAPLNIQIEWREFAFADLLSELQAGNVDIVIAGMYIRPDREDLVDMSNPYLDTGLVMASHGGITDIETVEDLAGHTVGVKEGSTGERFALRLQEEEGIALEIRRYTDTLDSLDDLDAGLVDVIFNDYINTLEYIKTHPNVRVVGEILEPAGVGISVQTGDTELLNFVNERLATLKTDGTIDNLFTTWMTTGNAE